jgi:peptidase E
MKRIILFSHVLESVLHNVLPLIFPESLQPKIFACMPCDGASMQGRHYELFASSWRDIAVQHQAEFVFINNAGKTEHERQDAKNKLLRANILLITGGNVCVLLKNLRQSGLDQAILAFTQKEQYVLAGYSAGAMILTPTIELAAVNPLINENNGVGLTNFAALNLVGFEIFPHYEETQRNFLQHYQTLTPYPVKTLTDEEYVIVEHE